MRTRFLQNQLFSIRSLQFFVVSGWQTGSYPLARALGDARKWLQPVTGPITRTTYLQLIGFETSGLLSPRALCPIGH
jgi:hypothetical protein